MLHSQFKMKDMGELHYCLGMNIKQNKVEGSVEIQQKQYILKLLERYGLKDSKPVATPADVNVKLKREDGISKAVDPVLYQSMIGGLLYAAIATRPDISQAVGVVSKYSSKPSEAHLTAAKRILCYLKGTADITLKYKKSESTRLIGYSDADYAGDLDDRHRVQNKLRKVCGQMAKYFAKY